MTGLLKRTESKERKGKVKTILADKQFLLLSALEKPALTIGRRGMQSEVADVSGVDIIEPALGSFGFDRDRAKVFAAVLVKVTPRALQMIAFVQSY